ncbi:MAG: histidinol-phosphate transaminase [Chloroflexi bacterium]|nr:histidinol-phosphate transaminase [Chloroflexota bacterium]
MVRAHYRELVPYVPIVPPEVLGKAGGVAASQIIKLDGNENPYGPSPKALEALRHCATYHIYPDPAQRELRAALADYVGVGTEHIIAGNGSDEIIDLVLRLFLEPGDVVLDCPPSFGMYPFNTQVCAGTLVTAPRRTDFSLDVEEALRQAQDSRAKVVFLASPNNPTGNLLRREELEALLTTGLVVVVDEAYQEFAEAPSYAALVSSFDNLVVLRTFSKWAGLAGLRVGYGVLAPALVRLLDQIKPPYNVNVAALVAAEASLADREHLMGKVGLLIAERERLYGKLREVPYLEPLPSRANFVLCRVQGQDAGQLKAALAERGIYVKHVDGPWLRNALRISVGKPEHTDALLAALNKM